MTLSLVAGAIIAAFQLLIVYIFIDPMLRRFENKKWKIARCNFIAGVLWNGWAVSNPLSHYIIIEGKFLVLRENIDQAFSHIHEKSRSFDNFLTIYSPGTKGEWLSELSCAADELRAAAISASVAKNNFDLLIDSMPYIANEEDTVYHTHDQIKVDSYHRSIQHSNENGNDKIRQEFCFNLLRCCISLGNACSMMNKFVEKNFISYNVESSFIYKEMTFDSDGVRSAEVEREEFSEYINHIDAAIKIIKNEGVVFALVEEKSI